MGFQELALLLLLFLPLCSAQSTYYITPTPDTPCPGEPCYNISAVVDYLTPDAVLVFLPGNYSLETAIILTDLNSLTLAGDSSSLPQVTTSIMCSQEAKIVFTSIVELFITDIALVSCGTSSTSSVHLEQVFLATISHCIFQGGQEGALTVSNSYVNLLNNTFENNSATINGSSIYMEDSTSNASGNIFRNNSASGWGGGIYIKTSTANVSGNIFTNNHAERWGGGVYLETSTVSFNSNLFRNNTASYGGGIEVSRNSNVSATNNTFTRNTAGIAGGGIEVSRNSNVSATNNTFTRNIAGIAGGGIDIDSGVVATFMDNILEYNQAQVDGGGISVTSAGSTVSFTLDSFISNSASRWGGGVYLENCTVSFNSNLFKNNTASYGGGIEVYRNSNVSATNNTFTRNTAGIAGGGIEVYRNSNVSATNNTFTRNTAGIAGGGIEVSRNSNVSATNNTFTRNIAGIAGGGIDIDSGVVATFMDNILEYNQAQVDGGGISVTSAGSTVSFTLDSFISNSASRWGGGVYLENCTVSFNSNLFKNNTASYGGGIEVFRNSNVSATNNTFTRNTAGIAGGGIDIDSGVVATFMDNILEYNQAHMDGGGFSVTSAGSTVSFTLDSFISNTADKAGGGIWIIDGIINVTKSNFIGNSAGRRGGGSYLKSGAANFHENVLINNSALFNGAGIYIALDTDSIECTNNTFRNNWGDGWVLFIEDSNRTSAVLSQNTFENNTGNLVYGSSKEISSVYHITPSPDTLCPNEPCLTISQFIDQANQYIALNTTLIFLPGTHTVKSGLLVEGIASLTLLGNSSIPLIMCDRPASLGFKYIDELFVRSLTFDSCGDGIYAAFSVKSVASVEILDCNFKNSLGSGGAVVVANCNTMLVKETVFENNSAVVGGGLYVNESAVNFIGNAFTNNKAEFGGAGITLLNCNATFTGMTTFRNNSVMSNGRELLDNDREFREGFLTSAGADVARFAGGAMLISNSEIMFLGNISIEKSSAPYGGGIMAQESSLTFNNTVCIQNNTATYGGGVCVLGSTITFGGPTDINITNNSAADSGGAVYAINSSQLKFKGTSNFKYNQAVKGGGLFLAHSSLCYFSATALLHFVQNCAKAYGGAIFVADTRPSVYCAENAVSEDLKSQCFFQVQTDKIFFRSDIQARINFSDNTANEGGGDLYGGTIDNCKLPNNISICSDYCDIKSSGDIFNTMTTENLDIASEPLRVCSCPQTSDCSQSSLDVYPGETVGISVTVLGQRNGIVSKSIQTQTSGDINITELQKTQSNTKSQLCSKLSFTISSSAESQQGGLTLSTHSPCSRDQNSLIIRVQMLACPPGFQLSNTTGACGCDERLKRFTDSCNIQNATVFRPSGSEFWVSYDNDTEGLILHPHCPFDYCTKKEMNIDVNNSDTQCSYNRSGVLCGECGHNFSLALGSSRCLQQCSNIYLALLLPFTIAGIILVLLLFTLKLTVSVGTIHGLIFYANVVQVNSAIFIPPGSTNPLTLLVAWLNLDLGIETCFYEGMDAYGKTWLQFVFPIYVWALVVIIIVVSHYSSGKIARLFGRNPIAVLATLFLLSYAKLLRTIIAAFAVTYAEYQGNPHVAVWLHDANIKYLSGKHVPLFIVAFLFLLLLFLPYTLLLLLSQWLQAWPKLFFFINNHRIKAFLDAYHAPYNDKHRYWTGLLLCVRCILFLSVVYSALGDVSVNLLSILSAVVGLLSLKALVLGGVYKNWYVGALETSFFLNLCILAAATYHVRDSEGNQAAVTYTLLSIAFVTFAGILIYHSYLQIRDTALGEKISTETRRLSATRRYSRKSELSELVDHADSDTTPMKLNTTAATYSTIDLSIRDSVVEIM